MLSDNYLKRFCQVMLIAMIINIIGFALPVLAYAFGLELIGSYITTQVVGYAAASIGAIIVGWILKRIPNEKIAEKVEAFFFGVGVFITLGLSKWKYTKDYWEKTIEPWFIDLIENVFGAAMVGLIRGLRSNNG